MIKNKFKTLSLILFICLPSLAISQTGSISSSEKKQLEERFKSLKTFYIDDDGLVVYQDVANNDSTQIKENRNPKSEAARLKVTVSVNDSGEYVVSKQEENFLLSEEDTILTIPENRYIKDDFSAKEEIEEDTASDDVNPYFIYNKPQSVKINSIQERFENNSYFEEDALVDSSSNKGNSVLNKEVQTSRKNVPLKKRAPSKSTDTTLAELDDLIGELRAQQNSRGKKGVNNSLSNKISGGVDASIRKNYSQDLSHEDGISLDNDGEETATAEPVYFINGVKSTKADFIKLKPEEIRRKEIRRSKENPSGEWWVQTATK